MGKSRMDMSNMIFNAKTRYKEQSYSDYINETNRLILRSFDSYVELEKKNNRYKDPKDMTFWFYQIIYICMIFADQKMNQVGFDAYCDFVKKSDMNLKPFEPEKMFELYKGYVQKQRYLDACYFIVEKRDLVDSGAFHDLIYGIVRLMFLGENEIYQNEYNLLSNLYDFSYDSCSRSWEEFKRDLYYLFDY